MINTSIINKRWLKVAYDDEWYFWEFSLHRHVSNVVFRNLFKINVLQLQIEEKHREYKWPPFLHFLQRSSYACELGQYINKISQCQTTSTCQQPSCPYSSTNKKICILSKQFSLPYAKIIFYWKLFIKKLVFDFYKTNIYKKNYCVGTQSNPKLRH